MGGSQGRTEATGYGTIITVREALKELNIKPEDTTASFQGFGNVSQYAIELYEKMGGKALCVSSWDNEEKQSNSFRKIDGIDLEELRSIADTFGGIDKVKAKALGYEVLPGEAWLEQEVDILVPAALENQITGENAEKIAQFKEAVRALDQGDKMMMNWMRNYKMPKEGDNSPETIGYLQMEKEKVEKMRDTIHSALEKTQQLLADEIKE